MPDDAFVYGDARERLAPELVPSPLFSLRQSPASGWGVYASQNLTKGTQLFECSNLAVSVVYRAFRKEACVWCFRYDNGRHWRVHVDSTAPAGSDQRLGVVAFCSDGCRDSWVESVGDIGIAAYGSVEDFVCRHSQRGHWAESEAESSSSNEAPSAEEIKEVSYSNFNL